jgi:hypothetical protein
MGNPWGVTAVGVPLDLGIDLTNRKLDIVAACAVGEPNPVVSWLNRRWAGQSASGIRKQGFELDLLKRAGERRCWGDYRRWNRTTTTIATGEATTHQDTSLVSRRHHQEAGCFPYQPTPDAPSRIAKQRVILPAHIRIWAVVFVVIAV